MQKDAEWKHPEGSQERIQRAQIEKIKGNSLGGGKIQTEDGLGYSPKKSWWGEAVVTLSSLCIRGVSTASPHPNKGKLSHGAGQRSGIAWSRACLWGARSSSGFCRTAREGSAQATERSVCQHRYSHELCPLSPSSGGATWGLPAASPSPGSYGAEEPPASGAGGNLLCQPSSGRGQGRRELSGCPAAAADLPGML